jgi:Zn-finger nucleic acid-binding protein
MRPVTFGSIEIDRCSSCQGLWFELLELEELQQLKGSEVVDQGSALTGALRDEQTKVVCPVDGVPMVRMVDTRQPHIWFETCQICNGSFLDAGEFRDMKEHTLAEFLRPRRRPRRL